MADITDVAQALVQAIANAIYPDGADKPSVCGLPVIVYQGWPDPQQLAADLVAGKAHVSVWPLPGDRVTDVMMGDTEWVEQTNDGQQGASLLEVRRQSRTFQVTVWANCFANRDPLAAAIDAALSVITRLALPDGTTAVMTYARSAQDDSQQKQGIYRRDLYYDLNYATALTANAYAILEIDLSAQRVAAASDKDSAALGEKTTTIKRKE
jgi:hypothetical protein